MFAHNCVNKFWKDLKDAKNSSYRVGGGDAWMDGWMGRGGRETLSICICTSLDL